MVYMELLKCMTKLIPNNYSTCFLEIRKNMKRWKKRIWCIMIFYCLFKIFKNHLQELVHRMDMWKKNNGKVILVTELKILLKMETLFNNMIVMKMKIHFHLKIWNNRVKQLKKLEKTAKMTKNLSSEIIPVVYLMQIQPLIFVCRGIIVKTIISR